MTLEVSHQAWIGHNICLSITYDYHNWVRHADVYFVTLRIFYDIDSDILQHWWYVIVYIYSMIPAIVSRYK